MLALCLLQQTGDSIMFPHAMTVYVRVNARKLNRVMWSEPQQFSKKCGHVWTTLWITLCGATE